MVPSSATKSAPGMASGGRGAGEDGTAAGGAGSGGVDMDRLRRGRARVQDLLGGRHADVARQPEARERRDDPPADIPLARFEAVAGAPREAVVVGVPAVAQAEEAEEPVVARQVVSTIRHRADDVRDAVDR